MFLERAHNHLRSLSREAIVIADHPSGGRRAESRFLGSCIETLKLGTRWVIPERLALVVTSDSAAIRLVQLADVVVSSTVAYVSGEDQHSPPIFAAVKPMLRREGDRIGGIGLKLHPDLRYANLYHWLVGDRYFIKGSVGHPLPVASMAYATGDRIP